MKNLSTAVLTAVVFFATLNGVVAQKLRLPQAQYQIQGNGIPANPNKITYKQPDGSLLEIILKGDATIHAAISDDGYTLLSNENGFYEYAKLDANQDLVSTGIVARNSANLKSFDAGFLSKIPKGLNYSKKQISQKLASRKSVLKSESRLKSFPSDGSQKNLVIMVEFPDLSFSHTTADFSNLMNQYKYNGIGSFKDYYFENSNGKLTINTTVKGVYVAAKKHDYYGQNDTDGSDLHVEELAAEAIRSANLNTNFSDYDNDGDGVVDCVYIIFAGTGESSSGNPSDIWPHNNPNISSITVDGVTVNSYTCSNELYENNLAGIGTICHEFGHVLGLPDFYDTDYEESGGKAEGTGYWDVMGSGSYNGNGASPANHNPISKAILNWLELTDIVVDGSYILPPSTQEPTAFVIDDLTGNEGFFLENRQWESFDYALPYTGLLIYHCDYDHLISHFFSNDINVNPDHQGFDIEEADNDILDDSGDSYPGTTNNTSFTDLTYPNSILWTGLSLSHPIFNIVENSTTLNIEFDVSGLTSISEVLTNNSIKIYPSPANEFINLTSNESIQEILIINIQGQVIMEYWGNDLQTQLNVSTLKSGTYFIKLKTSNQVAIYKIVIVH